MIDVHLSRVATDRTLNDAVAPAVPTVREPSRLYVDGELVAVYDRFRGDRRPFTAACRAMPMASQVRGAGMRSRSQTFGYSAKQMMYRKQSCGACSTSGLPAHTVIADQAAGLAAHLTEVAPDAAAHLAEVMSAVHPDWHLPGGLWTSGILNHTAALPFHFDRNNFDAWSAMIVVRANVSGGHLVLPELDAVIECADSTVLFFNGSRWLHGVAPIRARPGGYRYSAVYYPVRNMAKCLPAAEEFDRARLARTANETTLLDRQRKAGLIRSKPPRFVIPTFDRADTITRHTLTALAGAGVDPSTVDVWLSDPARRDEYESKVPRDAYGRMLDGQIGLVANRAAIRDHYGEGELIVHAVDDIRRFGVATDPKHLIPISDLPGLVSDLGRRAATAGARMFGLYPSANPFFMGDRYRLGFCLIVGAFYGTWNGTDPDWSTRCVFKEDYERSARRFETDGAVLRFDGATTVFNYGTGAGGYTGRDPAAVAAEAEYLCSTWPGLFSPADDKRRGWAEVRVRTRWI